MAIVKYYYAGGQRVALRENGTLHWLLSDHPSENFAQHPVADRTGLGSRAITADGDSGEQEAELRYRAYGENRIILHLHCAQTQVSDPSLERRAGPSQGLILTTLALVRVTWIPVCGRCLLLCIGSEQTFKIQRCQ